MSDATTATKATQERVWAAAREMEGEGREATSRAIIDRVGGSSETVLRHLRTYNKAKTPPSNVPAVPGALAQRFTGVLEAVWTEAFTIAAADMEAVRAKAAVDVAAEQRAADEAMAECGRLETAAALAQKQTAAQSRQLHALELALHGAHESQQRIAMLEIQSAAAAAEMNASREREAQSRSTADRLSGQVDALIHLLNAAHERLATLSKSTENKVQIEQVRGPVDEHASPPSPGWYPSATVEKSRNAVGGDTVTPAFTKPTTAAVLAPAGRTQGGRDTPNTPQLGNGQVRSVRPEGPREFSKP